MDSVFVTGVSGYVGSCLLPAIAMRAPRVVALARAPGRLPAGIRALPNVSFVTGDLRSGNTWTGRLKGCSAVVHLASITGKAPPDAYAQTIVDGTRRLVDAARDHGARTFVYCSTIAVGFPDQRRYFYAHAKSSAEELVRNSGLRHTIVRPTMVFGPSSPVLAGLARLAGAPIVPIFGSGAVSVQPVDVDDLVRGLVRLLERDQAESGTVEIGGPEKLTIEELLRRIRTHLGRAEPRTLHIPLGPVRTVLALLEPFALSVLPLTCGQLATFANDGTAESSAFMSALEAEMRPLDETLRRSLNGT